MNKRFTFLLFVAALGFSQTPGAFREKSVSILDSALADKNPDARKQAVIALSLAAVREPFLSKLEAALGDKDVQVRIAAVDSLADLRSAGTLQALRRALDDPVPEVSFAAAKALFGLHDPMGNRALLLILDGKSKTSSGFLSKQMRDVMRMMHTPRSLFVFALRQGMGMAPVPGLGAGVASMEGLLADPGISGRADAALLLGKRRDERTLKALRQALYDKDWSVRAAALHSLVLWNDPALKPDVATLLADEKLAVRLRAAAGYLRLSTIRVRTGPASVR